MFSCNQDKFTKQVGVIIPTDFYDIRAATPPKAGWTLMFTASILIYSAAIVAFALLFSYESGRSTVETIVVTDDRTGTDGYTCQMISRVTASYQSPSYGYPALAYNLVNVMESQQACKNNMAATSPCNTSMQNYSGTAMAFSPAGATFGAAAMFGTNLVYVFSSNSAYSDIISYDYSLGQYDARYVGTENFALSDSLAVDSNGYPTYVKNSTSSAKLVCRAYFDDDDFGPDSHNTVCFNTGSSSVKVFNDNLYNIYYSTDDSFYALNLTSEPPVSTLLFNQEAGEKLLYAAVYINETSPTVYYWTSKTGPSYTLYCFYNGTFITLYTLDGLYTPGGVVVDGLNNLYIVENNGEGSIILSGYHPNEAGIFPIEAGVLANSVPTGLAIDPLGERIIFLYRDVSQKQTMSFYYTRPYNDSNPIFFPEEVKIMNGFGASWFTCGDKLLDGNEYTPGAVAEYPEFCANNGVVGNVVYKKDYTFTATDASAYAVKDSAIHCPGLLEPICTKISNLPPYSCSRNLQQGFFNSAATAFANAQFLVQILILMCAVVLPFMTRIPPVVHRSNGDSEASDAEPDIELAIKVTQNNPMR